MELNLQHTPDELFAYSRLKKNGKISARLRAIAMHAQHESVEEISESLRYCRQAICEWIHRYNDHGIKGLFDLPRPGQPPHLSSENEDIFKKRILDGPTNSDEVSAFTGKFIIRILREEFNAEYSLSGVYNLLTRLKLSSLLPRPRHEKNDLNIMKKWEDELPVVVEDIKKKS